MNALDHCLVQARHGQKMTAINNKLLRNTKTINEIIIVIRRETD